MPNPSRIFIIACLILLGSILFGQSTREIDSLTKALKTLSRRDPGRVDALIVLGKHDKKKSEVYLGEALALAENINYLRGQIRTLSAYGSMCEQDSIANFQRSLTYYYPAAVLAEKFGDEAIIYEVYGQIFNACAHLGDYPKAQEIALKALALGEKTNNTRVMASQYNNIGFLYTKQNKYEKAKEYLVKYVELAEKVGNEGMMANAYNNMAEIHEIEKDYEAAREKLFKALKMYEAIDVSNKKKDPLNNHMMQYISLTYNNIASLYRSSKDIKTALKYSLKCLETASKVSINKYDLSVYYITNGNLYTLLGEYNKAKPAIEKGLSIANEIGHKEDQELAFLALSDMYAAKKDYEHAAYYHEKFTLVKNELLNERNLKQMTEVNTRYESEKKDKELIKKDVEIGAQISEAKQKTIIRNVSLVGFLLVLLLAVFIYRGNIIKRKANEKMSEQKRIIEHKNKEITDSIQYARRIQKALLANEALLSKHLHEHFVLYKPKDIVSGDFYWAHEVNGKFLICVADCTGHGVPGAFMSLLNISFLNESVIEKKMEAPDMILNSVRQSLVNTLNTEGNENSKDGMDCVLCAFDHKKNIMSYTAANNSFYIIRHNEIIVSNVDKMPVGRSPRENEAFSLSHFELKDGDMIYLLTDGYADQFGGPKGKKFRYKQLEDLLLTIHQLPMVEQQKLMNDTIDQWKSDIEQVDDILITGIKYKKVG